MCEHVFNYPPDIKENYDLNGKTLTGVCRYCGVQQKSYGMRWAIPHVDTFLEKNPFGMNRYEEDYLPYKY